MLEHAMSVAVADTSAVLADAVEAKLRRSRKAAIRLRVLVSGTCLVLSVVLLVTALTVFALAVTRTVSYPAQILLTPNLIELSWFLALLALLPTDRWWLQLVAALIITIALLKSAGYSCLVAPTCRSTYLAVESDIRGLAEGTFVAWSATSLFLALALAAAVMPIVALRRWSRWWPPGLGDSNVPGCELLHSRAALKSTWVSVRIFVATQAVADILFIVVELANDPNFASSRTFVSVLISGTINVAFALLWSEKRRGRLQAFISELGVRGETRQAAAVASLVGRVTNGRALKLAQQRFRTLPFDALREEDLQSNADTGLFERTVSTRLGECDVFLSHSWRDSGSAKFIALTNWAMEFAASANRQPRIWLDKACINQQNIEEDLACLPIFLAGCKQLLIIAGSTYSSRLWCALEVFTFLEMGGSLDRVTVVPIFALRPGQEKSPDFRAASDQLGLLLGTFDARQASCYKQEDQERLLAVMEASFGSLECFNEAVRTLFNKRTRNSLAVVVTARSTSATSTQAQAPAGARKQSLQAALRKLSVFGILKHPGTPEQRHEGKHQPSHASSNPSSASSSGCSHPHSKRPTVHGQRSSACSSCASHEKTIRPALACSATASVA